MHYVEWFVDARRNTDKVPVGTDGSVLLTTELRINGFTVETDEPVRVVAGDGDRSFLVLELSATAVAVAGGVEVPLASLFGLHEVAEGTNETLLRLPVRKLALTES